MDSHYLELDKSIERRAGMACRENFCSQVIRELDPDAPCAGDYLAKYTNEVAGEKPSARWFQLHPKDGGLGLQGIHLAGGLEGRVLGNEVFPHFLLRAHGHDVKHRKLIEAFFAWQAPWVLLLTDLEKDVRQEFDQQARYHALVVDKQHRLYPDIIGQSFINAARVEAMLRKSQEQKVNQEDIMSTFYIELQPSPGE